ncbi:TolC family protein [Flavobacterium fryxellicola]|uniref:TolC family protein n=1 Tax=Flavobacterium fryxellicola TaxID=249352 RepID=UPI001FE24DC6|nr:TolC family protein [Flavobacterium fryxellicola]
MDKPDELVLLFDTLITTLKKWQPNVYNAFVYTIVFTNAKTWLVVKPMKTALDLKIYNDTFIDSERIKAQSKYANKIVYHFRISSEKDADQETSSLDDISLVKSNLTIELNRTTSIESAASYRINVNYTLSKNMEATNVIEQVKSNNPAIQLAKQGLVLANNQIGLARSEYLPNMKLFANYGYFNQRNDIQQLAEIQNLGFVLGGSLRLNVFNGGKNRKDVFNAKINLEKQELTVNDTEEQIVTAAYQELNSLNILEKQLVRETTNLATFQETFNRTQDRYYNGQATNLDLRDTQTALLYAKIAINDIKLKIIQSTIRLNSLKGVVLE